MKEQYTMPVLIVQSFKVDDEIMSGASKEECWTWFCKPNGFPKCFENCYSGTENVDYGYVAEAR